MAQNDRDNNILIYVVAIAGILAMAILASAYLNSVENQKIHSDRLIVSERLCYDNPLGANVSKVRGTDGLLYFIDNEDCKSFDIGGIYKIEYQVVHHWGSSNQYDFRRITGYIRTV